MHTCMCVRLHLCRCMMSLCVVKLLILLLSPLLNQSCRLIIIEFDVITSCVCGEWLLKVLNEACYRDQCVYHHLLVSKVVYSSLSLPPLPSLSLSLPLFLLFSSSLSRSPLSCKHSYHTKELIWLDQVSQVPGSSQYHSRKPHNLDTCICS